MPLVHTSCRPETRRPLPWLLPLLLALAMPQLLGQVPSLVKNINTVPSVLGSSPTNFVEMGGVAYFACKDGVAGQELWRSDGTAAGTRLVKDIYPGAGGSGPSGFCAVNGTLFFVSGSGARGHELWKSDGTALGTVQVKVFAANDRPANLLNGNGTLFFTANDGTHGVELWKSDGTEAGTVLVKDIYPGSGASRPDKLVSFNGTLFFVATDGVHGVELWKSDGTAASTVMVKDIYPGTGDGFLTTLIAPSELVSFNGALCFRATDGGSGAGLWKSDGTAAGTVLVKAIQDVSCVPPYLLNANGVLFMLVRDAPHGTEWWRSDGTEAGTFLVKDIQSGPGAAVNDWVSKWQVANIGNTIFFPANDGTNGVELWKSDGTDTGTVMVKDIRPGSSSSFPTNLVNLNGTLFFTASDGAHGMESWRSDGTAAGTVLVKDIAGGSNGCNPAGFFNFNGMLLFSADDGVHGQELWKTDGTAAGTVMVADIWCRDGDASPGSMVSLDGLLLFSADDGVHGRELWSSDGTDAGTVNVKDIWPGSASAYPYGTAVSRTAAFFSARDGTGGYQLWRSDGTTSGTAEIHDFGNLYPMGFVDMGGTLFFFLDYMGADDLWKSDGTTVGTVLVSNLWTNRVGSNPLNWTVVGNTLYCTAYRPYQGLMNYRLWRSDGTAAGTAMVPVDGQGREFWPAANLLNVNGTLFFSASSSQDPEALWKWDPTAGPVRVGGHVASADISFYPAPLTKIGNTVFFGGTDSTNGTELWKSDGTASGTMLVRDIFPGTNGSGVGSTLNVATVVPVAVNGTLFFAANDGIHGTELWKSDGTTAGTRLVKDIWPGNESSSPSQLFNANGMLFFVANNGINGRELWRSDGTAARTVMVAELTGDFNDSSPANLIVAGDRLFFAAQTPAAGSELYSLPLLAAPPLAAEDTLVTTRDVAASLTTTYLLQNDVARPGGSLAFVDAATASCYGGSVSRFGNTLTYSPPPGFSGLDTFSYTIADDQGAKTLGTVKVTVLNPPALGHLQAVRTADGLLLTYAGIAGGQNWLQCSERLNGPSWQTLGQCTAGAYGVSQWHVTNLPSPGFFRVQAVGP